MNFTSSEQRFDTVVIGGGQAGLAIGYYLARQGRDFVILTMGDHRLEAEHIVVATGNQHPITPAFASLLDPTITQFHSTEYRHPNQLQQGDVLLVGAGNSGAEIALELAQTRRTWLADRDTGHSPKPAETPIIGPLYWWLIHQALTTDNKTGRRFKELSGKKGAPLVGISKKAFERAGVERAPRMVGVQDGKPALQDGRVLSLGKRDLVYGVYS